VHPLMLDQAATPRRHPVTRLQIEASTTVRMTVDPYASLFALACTAGRDLRLGRDTTAARLARHFSGRGHRALAPIIAPHRSVSPDCLTPTDPSAGTDITTELDRLRTMTNTDLQNDIERTFDGSIPRTWERIAEAPRGWLHDLADLMETLWRNAGPAWRREDRLRAREAERIGVAAARCALDVVLAGAHPRGLAAGGVLAFPDPEGTERTAAGRSLVLAPFLSILDISVSNLDLPDIIWLAYPVPDGARDTDPAGLDALLTPMRSAILRGLERASTMSAVATAHHIGPSTLTYHVGALAAAGLVTRRRDGRHVLVSRTSRGERLLDLYGAAEP
jgi:DNA-binding transcriptional ArsR family regulator